MPMSDLALGRSWSEFQISYRGFLEGLVGDSPLRTAAGDFSKFVLASTNSESI